MKKLSGVICTGCGRDAAVTGDHSKDNPVQCDGTYADGRFVCVDANFIAASPAIVDQLLEENERLKKDVDHYRKVGVHLIEKDHRPCKLLLSQAENRAQAAEDVAFDIGDEFMEGGDDIVHGRIHAAIEKRMAELKAGKK